MWLCEYNFARSLIYLAFISLLICFNGCNLHPTETLKSAPKVHAAVSATPRIREHFTWSDEGGPTRIVAMAVNGIGAILNTILIIAIIVDPLKVLHRGPWIMILNLAVADLVVCIANFMEVGLALEFGVKDPILFGIVRFLLIFGVNASFMLLTLLSFGTYLVTRYPLRSRLFFTDKKFTLFCFFAWILATPFGLTNIAYIFTDDISLLFKIYICEIVFLELLVVVQVILKMLIIREIRKSRRGVQIANGQEQNCNHNEIAKTIIILNVILVVTALPYFVGRQLEFFSKLGWLGRDHQLTWEFSNYYEPIAALNYIVNPIFYALRLPDYKRTLYVPFKKCGYNSAWYSKCWTCKKSSITTAVSSSSRVPQENVTTRC